MSVVRSVLKAIGTVVAFIGGAAAAPAVIQQPNDEGERAAPAAAVRGFGPDRLLGDADALAALAADPAAFMRARGLDPAAYRAARPSAGDLARFAAEWGAPANGAAAAGGEPVAQIAVYGPPPTPDMRPTPEPSPSPTPHRRRRSHAKDGRMSRPAPAPSPTVAPTETPSPSEPAPVYGPPPGAPNRR